MRKKQSNFRDSEPRNISAGKDVTKENYLERAHYLMEANGGTGFVIRGPEANGIKTPAQWRAWINYFSELGYSTIFMRQHGVGTVPTEWPEDFDPRAPVSDKLWAPLEPLRAETLAIEQRRANAQRFRTMIAEAFGPLPNDHRRKTPLAHLAPVRPPIDFSAPLTVSDELRNSNAIRGVALARAKEDAV